MTRSDVARSAALFLRLALATAFLSAVADRLGLWGPPGAPGVAWGAFDPFLAYAGSLVPLLPEGGVLVLGWLVTIAEVVLGVALLLGLRVREAAAASGVLLLGFALGMIVGDGAKAPFDASVFTASAGAFLLAVYPDSLWSVDGAVGRGGGRAERPPTLSPSDPSPLLRP